MSFLNQLKSQAQALQSEREAQDQRLGERTAQTEQACRQVLHYLQDLARQLSVIEPAGPALTLDGKTPWPAMKLLDFRVDARRKRLRDAEVFDYIAMGWRIEPQSGGPAVGVVRVNFPTDMRRVEERLMMGPVKHERQEVRNPEKNNVLQEVRYEYLAQTTADHEHGQVHFRLLNTSGFEVVHVTVAADRIHHALLDELAKRIVGQPNLFV